MSLLDFNVDDAKELKVYEPGDYLLKCVSAKVKDGKSDKGDYRQLLLVLDDPEVDDFQSAFMTIWLPTEASTPKQINQCMLDLREAYNAFELDCTGRRPDSDEFVGKTAWVRLSKTTDNRGRVVNRVDGFAAGAGA